MREWQHFVAGLEQELGADVVQKWLPKLNRFDAANIYLEAKDSFQISWFEEHVRPRLKGLYNNNQRLIKVHILEPSSPRPLKEEVEPLSFRPSPIDPDMTLENFVPSPENLVVHKLLSESSPFNPIYLYGPTGCGKTHLLMGTAIALKRSGKRIFFAKAETFTEHVVQAIRLGQMQQFRKIYRDIDALIIDDIHIFSKKTATQEEFFHTFNTLHTLGKLILLSAQCSPTQLSEVEPRLISRFEWGISLALEKSPLPVILEKKASLWNFSLTEDISSFLLQEFPLNPVLALQALIFRSKGVPVTPLIAEKLLADLLAKERENVLTPEQIIKAVAAHYGVTSEDLLGKSQMRDSVLPRQIAMYLCREKLKWPFQKIGELFGRDHSTVMSSIKLVQSKKVAIPEI